jgi:hypothetical protein
MYCFWPLMDANCTLLLGYWWHHSVCYTGLFRTPQGVITISPYNESWPSDVLSRSDPWISSVLNAGSQLAGWLLLTDSWLSRSTPLSGSPGPDVEHLLSRLYLPLQQLGCLGNLTVNSIHCHRSMGSACRHCIAMDLYFSVPCIRKNRCVGSVKIRTWPLSSSIQIWSTVKSVTIYMKIYCDCEKYEFWYFHGFKHLQPPWLWKGCFWYAV